METTDVAKLFFENVHTKKRFEVVNFDREAGTVTLIGSHNLQFTEKFTKERFQEMGYTLKQEVEGAAPPPPPHTGAVPPPPAP
jgi:hypothetical protein